MDDLPYWIAETLASTPAFLALYFGVGIPYVLALLPCDQWRRRIEVIALAIPCGAAVVTAWMFVLGTLADANNPLLRGDLVFGGALVLAGIGVLLAMLRQRAGRRAALRAGHETPLADPPMRFDERLLIGLIIAALIVRWVVIAYWPFTIYDALWVYGYQGRLYTLAGHIPDLIGYYPQFMSLQYTYGQLAFGAINDHAARAGLPILHLGAVLAAYVLGSRLISRRVGVYAAALWALYPHVGDWSRGGDLEILTAHIFTLAAAYFLAAWHGTGERSPARHRPAYALIAGLLLGVGLWTKPTLGAFIWGVMLLAGIEAGRQIVRHRGAIRRAWNAAWPRMQVVFITGAACIPLGGVWYVRNILLGHPPVDLPPGFWLTQAARSGVEFGWPVLFGAAGLIGLYFTRHAGSSPTPRPVLPLWIAGLVLIGIALIPSILDPRRMTAWELAALIVGVGCVAYALVPVYRGWSPADRRIAAVCLGGAGLALPYFITWFWSYSYHFRLSFAIVPLMALPTAVVIARWPGDQRRMVVRGLVVVALIAAGLPGIVSAVYDTYTGWDYLWTDAMPDDRARVASGNLALMNVVDGLDIWLRDHPGQPLRVTAPGVERLPFFFPDPRHVIDVESVPTRLDDLHDDVYFVYGAPETVGRYEGISPLDNQVTGALGRVDILRRAWGMDDGIFRYDVYELHLANRFNRPVPNGPVTADVQAGGWARYLGYDIGGLELWPGRRVIFHTYWEVLATPADDWTLYVHLIAADGRLIATWDGPVNPTREGEYYSTRVWQPGEYVMDERVLELPPGISTTGTGYQIVIGFYDFVTGERVPFTVDGAAAGDGYTVENRIDLLPAAP